MSPHTEKMATRRQQIRADHTRIRLILFLSLVIALLLAAVFAEWICPYDPNGQDLSIALQPPSPAHPFGTDRYGRDMLSRVLMGGQTSIFFRPDPGGDHRRGRDSSGSALRLFRRSIGTR